MKIVVNCRLLKPARLDGIGVYALELLSRLVQERSDWQFVFVYDKIPADAFAFPPNVKQVSWICPTYRPPLMWAYLRFLDKVCRREKADVLFSPDGWAPKKTSVPLISTIHDLNFERNPEYLPGYWARMYRGWFPVIARNADKICTVSRFSASEIETLYGIPPGKIVVTYNATSENFKPVNAAEKEMLKARFSEGKPYFVYVGTLHERKNIRGMMQAYRRYRELGGTYAFVIVGDALWGDARDTYTGKDFPWAADLYFTGRVGAADLRNAYAASEGLFFVPFYEGFGIPVLEAMACGVPVLTSTLSSLPEVAGDAALLADPHDTEKMASALLQLEKNPELCAELVKKGEQQYRRFSWDDSAAVLRSLLRAYEKT